MAANDLKNNSFISSYLPSAVFITQRLIGAKEMSETNNSDKHNKVSQMAKAIQLVIWKCGRGLQIGT